MSEDVFKGVCKKCGSSNIKDIEHFQDGTILYECQEKECYALFFVSNGMFAMCKEIARILKEAKS